MSRAVRTSDATEVQERKFVLSRDGDDVYKAGGSGCSRVQREVCSGVLLRRLDRDQWRVVMGGRERGGKGICKGLGSECKKDVRGMGDLGN